MNTYMKQICICVCICTHLSSDVENLSQWSFTEVGDAAQNTSSGIRKVSDEKGEMQLTDPSTAQELTADGPRGLAYWKYIFLYTYYL